MSHVGKQRSVFVILFKELRAICLETVESLSEGVDYLLNQKDRFLKMADLCLSLHQKRSKIDEQFEKKRVDRSELIFS